MTHLILSIVILIIGFAALSYAADRLVFGAAQVATSLGVSALTIGITVVALGTSLPEVVVSVHAAINGNPEIAVGNAFGSNIANLALVLGLVMVLVPMTIRSQVLFREMPVLLLVMLLTYLLMLDGWLSRFDGVVLLVAFVLLICWLFRKSKTNSLELVVEKVVPASKAKAWGYLILGLVLLPISAHFIVNSAVAIAEYFKVSDLIIGLTIVALGTSLPELATCLAGARRKEFDLVAGNIVGSNIFNLVAVLSLPAIIYPIRLRAEVFTRDIPVLFAITILFYGLSFFCKQDKRQRWQGALLLFSYVAYLLILFTA
jgi:cation:H+ antiporter